MRLLLNFALVGALFVGISCKNMNKSGEGEGGDMASSVEAGSKSMDESAGAAKAGVDEAAGGAADSAGGLLAGLDVSKILSADFSVADVKGLVEKLEVPQLTELANGLLASFEGSQATVSTLKGQVPEGEANPLLETQLKDAEAKSDGILEKLNVLIDGIAQKGGDASPLKDSLTKLIGG